MFCSAKPPRSLQPCLGLSSVEHILGFFSVVNSKTLRDQAPRSIIILILEIGMIQILILLLIIEIGVIQILLLLLLLLIIEIGVIQFPHHIPFSIISNRGLSLDYHIIRSWKPTVCHRTPTDLLDDEIGGSEGTFSVWGYPRGVHMDFL